MRSLLSSLALTLSLLPVSANAQATSLIQPIGGCDFVTGRLVAECIPIYIGHLIGFIFSLTGAVFIIMIMVGGYQYALGSAGIGQKEQGLARIRFGILGFLVSALAFFIVQFVISTIADPPNTPSLPTSSSSNP